MNDKPINNWQSHPDTLASLRANDPCVVAGHRWAHRFDGGIECTVCGRQA